MQWPCLYLPSLGRYWLKCSSQPGNEILTVLGDKRYVLSYVYILTSSLSVMYPAQLASYCWAHIDLFLCRCIGLGYRGAKTAHCGALWHLKAAENCWKLASILRGSAVMCLYKYSLSVWQCAAICWHFQLCRVCTPMNSGSVLRKV